MYRRHSRAAQAVTATVALGALMAPGAAAHITVQPTTSRPADLQRYRVFVPNERQSDATTGVDIQVPAGITFVLAESVAGWRAQVVRDNDTITELRWRGGRVPPNGYAELHFLARNPVKTGPMAWKSLQRYGTDVVRWIGPPESDEPAPITTLSENAVPQDVHSTQGEKIPTAPAATDKAKPAAAAEPGRDTLTLGLAIIGAALGATALGLRLVRRRD